MGRPVFGVLIEDLTQACQPGVLTHGPLFIDKQHTASEPVVQILLALAALNAAGAVHGDITGDNILYDMRRGVFVLYQFEALQPAIR